MQSTKKLFLLDAYALIFRGYYALIKNPRVNSKGMDTSAIFGFTNSFLDIIKREKPDYLAVAFDKGKSVMRTEAYEAYKANRQETPEAIKIAVPYIKNLLDAMHVPVIEKEGFEADDLIGTLSKQAEQEGFQVYMVTPDKDFAQLVSENIFMYVPPRGGAGNEIWGIEKIKEKFEVEEPIQVIDYLAMMGDAVDNIPGLPGVGDKTAKKFIKAYGSLENLLENTHEIKGKLREKIEGSKEQGILSKKLATILLDCPITFNSDTYKVSDPNLEKVKELFEELEFRRTLTNFYSIFKKDTETNSKKVIGANTQLELFSELDEIKEEPLKPSILSQYVNTPLSYELLLKKLKLKKSVAITITSKGDRFFNSQIEGIIFSFGEQTSYSVELPSDEKEKLTLLEKFKIIFEDETIEKIVFNGKFYAKLLLNYGIKLSPPFFDTQIAQHLINPDLRNDMTSIIAYHFERVPSAYASLSEALKKKEFSELSLEDRTNYGGFHANFNFKLKSILKEQLLKQNAESIYKELELPLLEVLLEMEREGILLDVDFLKSLSEELSKDTKALQETIFKETGTFNLASPKQLGEVLFDKLKLVENPKKTRTGQYATGEEILSNLATKYPIVKEILAWRSLVKLQNTYVDTLPEEINKETGRIHTRYSQTVASTGRLSSLQPNLQNIPIRTERGRQVRKAFIAKDKNYKLVAADYSQIELRIIASLSGDENMIQAFINKEDIHASTAAKIFDIPIEEVTRDQRGEAKAVNFGILYGQGSFTLAQQLNKTRAEAKELIESYYKNFPGLKIFIAEQIQQAREKGYVETILGRRRYLRNINSSNGIVRSADERNAINAPIQGSAADIIKIAMIRIHKLMKDKKFKSKMLLQIHDELLFDVHNEEFDEVIQTIKNEMESAYQLSVPLVVDIGSGANWLEAH